MCAFVEIIGPMFVPLAGKSDDGIVCINIMDVKEPFTYVHTLS